VTGTARTILVVDDDREIQSFLGEAFEREGWRVISERDGDWALRAFERRHVDAVVLDILIPVVDGFQVAERIRELPAGRAVGIVMLTGIYRGPKHRAEAIEKYGLIDYLDKPVDAERLCELLRAYFASLPAPAAGDDAGATPAPRVTEVSALIDERQRQEKREVETAARAATDTSGAASDAADNRGNLKRLSFPRLLARLHAERRTGGLFLLRDKIKKIIYFKDGHPSFIKSNVLDECLGRVLVRERMISEGECEESVRRMKQQKRQQGSVLIEMGVISPHNLRFGLELQLQVKLFDIFDWPEGEFVFRSDVQMPGDVIGVGMSAAQIVLEGIRRAYHHDRLVAALRGSLEQYPALAAEPERRFQDLELSAAERELVRLMDGTRTLAEIIGTPLPGLDAHGAMALTLALEAMGIIALTGERGRARAASLGAALAASAEDGVPDELLGGDTVPSPRRAFEPSGGVALPVAYADADLAALLADKRGQDAFHVLGIDPGATDGEIERAYGTLLRELHPDRFRGRPEGTLRLASEAFELVAAAHRELVDPRARRRLAAARKQSAPPPLPPVEQMIDDATSPTTPSSDPAARALAADKLFREAEIRLGLLEYERAEQLLVHAVELRPDMGLYHALLGWSVFCARGHHASAPQAALPILEAACELSPVLEQPHLYRGLVYAAIDQPELAEPELEKAVQCNPDSADALRELRLIHLKRQS
jgi:DNA-binding response OmpR family regulator